MINHCRHINCYSYFNYWLLSEQWRLSHLSHWAVWTFRAVLTTQYCLMIIHHNSLNSQIKLHVSTISSVSMRVATSVHGKSFPRHFKRSHAHKQYSVATVAWVFLMRVTHQSPRSVTFSASWLYDGMSKLLASYSYSMTQH